jgi:hypothetical protein
MHLRVTRWAVVTGRSDRTTSGGRAGVTVAEPSSYVPDGWPRNQTEQPVFAAGATGRCDQLDLGHEVARAGRIGGGGRRGRVVGQAIELGGEERLERATDERGDGRHR